MPAQSFYWRGSTAANINSFNWDIVANWRVQVSGSTGARLIPATRLPIGGDSVFFGGSYQTGVYTIGASAAFIMSPCLFGGVSTANGWWSGATAGGTTFEKFGPVYVRVGAAYPFSKIGGKVDLQILNEYSRNIQIGYFKGNHPGVNFPIASGSTQPPRDWTLESGEEYTDAVYTSVWNGTAVGISFAQQPSGFSGEYAIRCRGPWTSATKKNTTTTLWGVTATSSGATTASYDGSSNILYISSENFLGGTNPLTVNINNIPGLISPNIGAVPYGDTFGSILTYTPNPYGASYGLAPEMGDVQHAGPLQLGGAFNKVSCSFAVRGWSVSLENAKVNGIDIAPSFAGIGATNSSFISFVSTGPTTGSSTVPYYTDMEKFFMDSNSTARLVSLTNIDQYSSPDAVAIHGDITGSGGFACANPAGASSGITGGAAPGIPNGSLVIVPPARASSSGLIPVIGLGFPNATGKQNATITSVYAAYGQQPVNYSLKGAFSNTHFHLQTGKLEFSSDLPNRATINIENLYMGADSEFDASPASPQYEGSATVNIYPASNATVIKPGSGNRFIMSNLINLIGG